MKNPLVKSFLEESGIRGMVTFKNYLLKTAEAFTIDSLLSAGNLTEERHKELILRLSEICTVREFKHHNMVVMTGRSVFARRLIGDTTYTGTINYGALGTASTAVVDGNTQLATEVFRKGIASKLRTNDSLNFDFYFSKADTNGTYQEFGMFIDGTATVNTGQLFNRMLTGGWTKTASEAMTVSVQIDIDAI